MKATIEVTRVVKGLEDQIDTFEKRKLHDLKTILANFVRIELSFHTKAVELLTKAYQDVAEIDEIKDLEVRKKQPTILDSNKTFFTMKFIASYFSINCQMTNMQDFQLARGDMTGVIFPYRL